MKDLGLVITIEVGPRQVDFLDANFDLSNSVSKPYRKPNDNPCYVQVHSNHPLNTIKQLSSMVNQRLCGLYLNAEVFREYIPLEKKGYKENLVFQHEAL